MREPAAAERPLRRRPDRRAHRHSVYGGQPHAEGKLDQSLDYIERHCFEPIRLHGLASLLGLSESHFSHAFKASTGVPPLRWQMETRVGKVKDLLLRDDLTLTDISAMTGFADQAHLTRSFKKVVGVTPSEWRRSAPRPRG
jgi:AraC family transcriptional regulator